MDQSRPEGSRAEAPPPGGLPPIPDPGPSIKAQHALTRLRGVLDTGPSDFSSHRPVIGPLVTFARTLIARLLGPVLRHQAAIDASAVEVMGQLIDGLAAQRESLVALRRELLVQQGQVLLALHQAADHQRRLGEQQRTLALQGDRGAALDQEIGAQKGLVAELTCQLAVQRDRVEGLGHEVGAQKGLVTECLEVASRVERRLRSLLSAGPEAGPSAPGVDSGIQPGSPALYGGGFDYAGFEQRFRGSEEEVKERQRMYVEVFRDLSEILDFGCGRGEFLELLRDGGIRARGVDADLDMILLCREKGLDVVQADGFAYLEAVPDGSLGGVFAAQVIEHLQVPDILRLIALIHRKLRPGGATVLETVNPECLLTYQSFYLDPTHVRPIPPATLRFLLESAGFSELRIAYAAPFEEHRRIPRLDPSLFADAARFNRSIDDLNSVLYGYQDFAAIGVKTGRG